MFGYDYVNPTVGRIGGSGVFRPSGIAKALARFLNADRRQRTWQADADARKSPGVEEIMHTQLITYADQDTPLTGFLAWDDTQGGRRPGILVVHGGAGLDDHAKDARARGSRQPG
jgi:hypothetical protein